MLLNLRNRALAESERELQNIVSILAEQTDRAFKAVALLQSSLIERMQALGVASAEDYERQMSGYDVHLTLKDKVSGWPHIGSITLINSQGKLFNFSRLWPLPNIDVTDREFYKVLKSNALLTSFMGEPVLNRATGTWTIHLVRKVTGPNGEFLGLVLGAMEMEYFGKYFGTIALGAKSSISLFRDDGVLLARHPHVDPTMASSHTQSELLMNVLSRTSHGAVQQIGSIDGEDRLISAQRLAHYPFVMMATVPVATALADWRSGAIYMTVAAVLMMFMIGGIVFLSARQVEKRLREQNLQLDTALNNMRQGLLLFDSTSQLVLFNQRYLQMYGLSPETVKWHLKNIYAKLGVNGRGKAAARLRDLAAGELVARAA